MGLRDKGTTDSETASWLAQSVAKSQNNNWDLNVQHKIKRHFLLILKILMF